MEITKIREIADEVANEQDLRVYTCEFRDSEDGKELYVEVDRPSFIDMDGIVKFSEAFSKRLDEIEDEIEEQYVLNCSSADPEREITGEKYSDYISSTVKVITNEDSIVLGELVDSNDELIVVRTNTKGRIKNVQVSSDNIKKINLQINI